MRKRTLRKIWFGPTAAKLPKRAVLQRAYRLALKPLSIAYGAVVARRRHAYGDDSTRVTKLAVPVVVIGNLIVGGSGKTPLVIALVHALRAAGYTPGVVSRGHGGRVTKRKDAVEPVELPAVPVEATPTEGVEAEGIDEDDAAAQFGDEPVLVRERTNAPVFVARDRVRAAEALLAAHPEVDVILSDDGLQHYALGRNFEIVVFDSRGAGNGLLLPQGPLREPLARAEEVDAIVLNGDDAALPRGVTPAHAPYRMRLVPGTVYRVNNPAETSEIARFRGRRLTAAAGIGHPERFFGMLRGMGLSFHRMPLDDHFAYETNPFTGRNSEAILMTEKDAVKCRRFHESRMWAVPVTAQVDPQLVEAVLAHIGGRKTPAAA